MANFMTLKNALCANLVSDETAQYAIGFFSQDRQGRWQRSGSGTFVSAGTTKAILTADHVLDALPDRGPVGLSYLERFGLKAPAPVIQMEYCEKRRVGRGDDEMNGPDLGLLVLPKPDTGLSSSINFYNLESRRNSFDPSQDYFRLALLLGVPAEWEPEIIDGQEKQDIEIMGCVGSIRRKYLEEEFDYVDFVAEKNPLYDGPESFAGLSGGGLWIFPMSKKLTAPLPVGSPFLFGVAFWQSSFGADGRNTIKCNGPGSIYVKVIRALLT